MMYGSLAMDLDGYSAFYKPNILLDPESSEITIDEEASDSFEETDDDRDIQEEPESVDSTSGDDSEFVSEPSGEHVSLDHYSDDSPDNENIQSAAETETGSDAGSDIDIGTDSGDSENGEENRIEENQDDSDFDSFESDGDEFNRELDNDSSEYDESETVEYDDGSGDSESSTEIGTSVQEDSSTTIEFYNQSLELLGIIAGLLFFIAFTIVMKYIYRFFRLFI